MPIVYFDGHCNLCNSAIDFLIRRDPRRVLKFAPLQGETAKQRLPEALVKDLGTVAFEDERGVVTESTAALRALGAIGGVYRLAPLLIIIPRFIRDRVYRFVARHRYRWFGRRDTCRLPTPAEKAQFLN